MRARKTAIETPVRIRNDKDSPRTCKTDFLQVKSSTNTGFLSIQKQDVGNTPANCEFNQPKYKVEPGLANVDVICTADSIPSPKMLPQFFDERSNSRDESGLC